MRRPSLALAVGLCVALAMSPVTADEKRVSDPKDLGYNLDVKWVSHDHGDRHRMVRHGIGSYGRWRDRGLRGYTMRLELNTNKTNAFERSVRIDYRDGRLRAAMYKGKFMDVKVPGRVRMWRPTRRTIWVSFDADMLRDGIKRYRWSISLYQNGECPGSCDFDGAPDNGWIRHRL